MPLSSLEITITIAVLVLGTMITRFLPFIIFPENKKTPRYIIYLSTVLPYSVIGMLVVYLLKDITILSNPYGLPETISICIVVILHLYKRNTLLSIGVGTISYMLLVQFVFV